VCGWPRIGVGWHGTVSYTGFIGMFCGMALEPRLVGIIKDNLHSTIRKAYLSLIIRYSETLRHRFISEVSTVQLSDNGATESIVGSSECTHKPQHTIQNTSSINENLLLSQR
jgi:hypothetical protein